MEVNNKLAYLIMAHQNFEQLAILLELLDDIRNDIFIHVDKKVKTFDKEKLKNSCKFSKVIFTKKRINIKWGGAQQIYTEMLLFEVASKYNYSRYHLISGVDLPLKSQKEIFDFCNMHMNKEFIHISDKTNVWDIQRMSFYYFPHHWLLGKQIDSLFWIMQSKLKINRFKKYNMVFKKGGNWCSLTNEAVTYLLKNKKVIFKMCKLTCCADECYKQCLLYNQEYFRERIYIDENGKTNDLREIDWTNCVKNPHIYTIQDWEKLNESKKFFARKFDINKDPDVIFKIYNQLKID